ncbi:MAG: carbohydrate-binding domain-containing protein [Clostridia bacterium]|nr:carbohydrate-binding domain-containing protein [Clostridia bacterium]
MNKISKVLLLLTLALALISMHACGKADKSDTVDSESVLNEAIASGETLISLSDGNILVNGEAADSVGEVYLSNDIIYYEDLEAYPSGHAYGEGSADERHTAKEAEAHTVVNISAPGTYRISGKLPLGQIRVDLGEDAKTDPDAKVTLVLDNADITCEVAPAILFLNVYECDNAWAVETAKSDVDTSAAGANIVIADQSINTVKGSYVARIYKDGGEEKKLWKQDGAVYSYMSMNVNGEQENSGVLDITAENEGLDTELHLTVNGGNINIRSGNDGINTNEDGVSVTTVNGGNIHIIAGLGEEGDGIDSNGWLVINGGTVISSANPAADAGLDSDMGSYINGGTVVALGSTMDWAESDSDQITMNLQFAEYKESDSAIIVTREDGSVVFAYDPSEDEVVGENIRRYMGAVISSPAFELEATYNVYIGGTLVGDETAGVYDPSTVVSYEGAVKQAYTGTDVMQRPGGFGGGRPGMGGMRPEMPEGMPERPEGGRLDFEQGEPPAMPQGERPNMENGERPERPDDDQMPQGGFGGRGMNRENADHEFDARTDPAVADTAFYMQDKVNFFSGVTDIAQDIVGQI